MVLTLSIDMNSFEVRVINKIGNMPNIAFWTRNIEKKEFRINGFKSLARFYYQNKEQQNHST